MENQPHLWTYNLGIHNGKTGKACMHMHYEGIALRGSQEVGSCLLKNLREMNTDARQLILFSDSCGGQNRNINITCLLLYIVSRSEFSFTQIDQKFMVPGHLYLPNDRDFGSVEPAKRQVSTSTYPNTGVNLSEKPAIRIHFISLRWTHLTSCP